MLDNEYGEFNYTSTQYAPEPALEPKKKSGAGKIAAILLTAALIGGASGFGGAFLATSVTESGASLTSNDSGRDSASTMVMNDTPVIESLKLGDANAAGLTTSQVIEKVTPSVVSISTEFSDQTGAGTGIILTEDGYIVTNAHVVKREVYPQGGAPFGGLFGYQVQPEVETSASVTVILHDEKEHTAKIIGTDTTTDLAVLKIEAKNLVAAEIGDSELLQLGDKAITLGYPLDLGLCASDGIISGLNKTMTIELVGGLAAEMTLIQTDAAINPGNSGGPLLNDAGHVVGITSSKLVYNSIEGIGFAIPITDAMPLLAELMDKGVVTNAKPRIGISGDNVNTIAQRYYNLPVDKGVIVMSVDKGSAADKAGIKEGDIIVGANGEEVSTMDELIIIKDRCKIGDTLTLTLARSEGNIDIELILGGWDD